MYETRNETVQRRVGAGPEKGRAYWLHVSRSPDRQTWVAPLAARFPLRRSSKIHDLGGVCKIEKFELVTGGKCRSNGGEFELVLYATWCYRLP
jgi:hypothetical protein